MDRILLRVNEVADALGLGRSKAYELIKAGTIPSIRIGRSVRVRRVELERWIKERSSKADNAEHLSGDD